MLTFQITNLPVADYGSAQRDHLWIVLANECAADSNTAIYFGPDGDIDVNDLTSRPFRYVIGRLARMGVHVHAEEIRDALNQYRAGGQRSPDMRRAA